MSSKFDNIFGINEAAVQQLKAQRESEENGDQTETEHQQKASFTLDRAKSDGHVKKSLKNVETILQNDPVLKNKFKFNVDSQELEVVDTVKFPKQSAVKIQDIQKGIITDDVANAVMSYISCNPLYDFDASANMVSTAITVTALAQQYDPLKEYFDGLHWDGKDRLNNVMHDFLGAEKTPENQLAYNHWMQEAVAKVYDKSVKADEVLDLVGGQGVGKTSFFNNIAPLEMYTQGFNTFTNKDDLARVKGVLIANDDEMTASARSSFEEIKSFITNNKVEYRAPYGHFSKVYHHSFVLCRTSNEVQHLSDKSGDRRFMSIQCGVVPKKYDVNDKKQFSKEYIDQLWAQAKYIYEKNHGSIKLTQEQYDLLKQGRRQFLKTTDMEDVVLDLINDELSNTNFVSNDAMRTLMRIKLNRIMTNKDMAKVRYYMNWNGWTASVRGVNEKTGKRCRGFGRNEQIQVNPNGQKLVDIIHSEINYRNMDF